LRSLGLFLSDEVLLDRDQLLRVTRGGRMYPRLALMSFAMRLDRASETKATAKPVDRIP